MTTITFEGAITAPTRQQLLSGNIDDIDNLNIFGGGNLAGDEYTVVWNPDPVLTINGHSYSFNQPGFSLESSPHSLQASFNHGDPLIGNYSYGVIYGAPDFFVNGAFQIFVQYEGFTTGYLGAPVPSPIAGEGIAAVLIMAMVVGWRTAWLKKWYHCDRT